MATTGTLRKMKPNRGLGPAANSDIERAMPQNIEAERSILGSILLDNKSINPAVERLKPEDFFHDHHRRIYQQIITMGEAQQAIDLVTLTEQLQRAGELESAGGAAYVSQLMDGMPQITNVEHYARIVKEKSLLRDMIHVTSAIQQQAFDAADDIDAIFDRAGESIAALRFNSPATWNKRFHTVEELPEGEPVMPIARILPEGITFLGANSGSGKTWLALAMARALISGRKFLGVWDVPELCNVLYLCPEMNARTFKKRCRRFGIGGDRFRCMTISDGIALNLEDPLLRAAIRELRPILFLDTAIRFSSAEDENSASENAHGLGPAIFALVHAGAKSIVCLHHRSKGASLAEDLTLENCLRGTTDLGAICDAVYGLQFARGDGTSSYLRQSKQLVRLSVRCVKARDFIAPDDFQVQLDPHIDEIGDMAVVDDSLEWVSDAEKVDLAISANLQASLRNIERNTGVHKDRIKKLADERGWFQDKLNGWVKNTV